jgi:hypothetical protein
MIDFYDLLQLNKLDMTAKIKMVRHQEPKYNLADFRSQGIFDLYQTIQGRPVFDKCDYLVSFIGQKGSRALFCGVYKVNGRRSGKEIILPEDFPYPEWKKAKYSYLLDELPGFEDLKDRVIIDWGGSPRAWVQRLHHREVVEILPKGYVKEFPGYLDFVLSYDELVGIIRNSEANREWHRMLAGVAGVYLISDKLTGRQYIGSAYGEAGILGRWTHYAKTIHAGNTLLRELVTDNPAYAANFQFTILQTLPRTLTQREVINFETLYKKKLGSRAFGLNNN